MGTFFWIPVWRCVLHVLDMYVRVDVCVYVLHVLLMEDRPVLEVRPASSLHVCTCVCMYVSTSYMFSLWRNVLYGRCVLHVPLCRYVLHVL